jgi:hypothetical protein
VLITYKSLCYVWTQRLRNLVDDLISVLGRAVAVSARCCYPVSDLHNPVHMNQTGGVCSASQRASNPLCRGGEVQAPSLVLPLLIPHPLQPAVPKHEDPLDTGQSTTVWQAEAVREECKAGIMQALTSTETYSLSVLSIACISVLVNAWRSDGEPLFASLAISGVAFAFSYALIPWTGDVFIRKGFSGKDLSKRNPTVL